MKKRIYTSVFIIALVLISLLLVEITVRLFVFKEGSVYSNIYECLKRNKPRYVGQPYLNYINYPEDSFIVNVSETNRMGLRSPHQTALEKPADVYRIIFLGGSTTYGEVDFDKTYPSLIEQSLNRKIDTLNSKYTKVECLNAGLSGATSAEILTHYLFKLNYLQPNLIVINLGVNDAMAYLPLQGARYQPDYHNTRRTFPDITPLSPGLHPFLRSKAVSFLIIRFVYKDYLPGSMESNLFYKYNNDNSWFSYGNDSLFSKQYNAFYNNLENLIAVAHARHQKVLLVPDVIDELQAGGSELPDSVLKTLEKGFIKNKEFLLSLSEELNVPVCNLASANFPTEVFNPNDGVHLNAKGEKIKADFIESSLIKMIKPD